MININEREERARSLFREGYNCCQSVVLAYPDITNVDINTLATVSAPFGGGMGRLREVCGAVSGMALLAGFISPSPTPCDGAAKSANYVLVQTLAESFRERNKFIVCRDLLGLTVQKQNPTPEPRTEEYYKKRPCVDLVGDAARIVGEYINSQNEIFAK